MGRNNGDFAGGSSYPVYHGDGLADYNKGARWSDHALTERQASPELEQEPGHRYGRDVALLPVHQLTRFRTLDREGRDARSTSEKNISNISEDLRTDGVGAIREPLYLMYNHKEKWATLGEGHHRLAAALRAGVTHLPVKIVRGWDEVAQDKAQGKGAPLHLDTRLVEPGEGGYFPSQLHPGNFQEFEGAR
jgi:hypothetical protein